MVPATGKGNLSNTIGAEQGIEFFGGDSGPGRSATSRQDLSRAGPRNPRLRRDRRAGRRRRPGRDGCGHRRRPPRRRRAAGRALQPPGRPLHRRPRHLDRPHDGLVGPAHHPRHRQRPDGAAAQGRDPGPPAQPTGAPRTPRPPPTGRSAPPPTTASSPGRRPSIPRRSRPLSMQMVGEAKVRLLLHAWAAAPILEGNVVKGAIFESKEGRHADLRQGGDRHHGRRRPDRAHAAPPSSPTSTRATSTTASTRRSCSAASTWSGGSPSASTSPRASPQFMALGRQKLKFFEKPFVSWRNDVALFMGPRLSGYSAVDVEDLTAVELRSRQLDRRPPRGLPRPRRRALPTPS